jgi:hypothetical protein
VALGFFIVVLASAEQNSGSGACNTQRLK